MGQDIRCWGFCNYIKTRMGQTLSLDRIIKLKICSEEECFQLTFLRLKLNDI